MVLFEIVLRQISLQRSLVRVWEIRFGGAGQAVCVGGCVLASSVVRST